MAKFINDLLNVHNRRRALDRERREHGGDTDPVRKVRAVRARAAQLRCAEGTAGAEGCAGAGGLKALGPEDLRSLGP